MKKKKEVNIDDINENFDIKNSNRLISMTSIGENEEYEEVLDDGNH